MNIHTDQQQMQDAGEWWRADWERGMLEGREKSQRGKQSIAGFIPWRALYGGPHRMFVCDSLEASPRFSRPNSFVRLVLAAEPRRALTRSYCVDPK